MKIAIIGAGAWGTALAVSAGGHPDARHQVSLWVRDPQQAIALQQQRVNLFASGRRMAPSMLQRKCSQQVGWQTRT
jgi:glycerol-3-phosphate dehydrogenase